MVYYYYYYYYYYIILAVPTRKCCEKHWSMSSPFPRALLKGTCFFREMRWSFRSKSRLSKPNYNINSHRIDALMFTGFSSTWHIQYEWVSSKRILTILRHLCTGSVWPGTATPAAAPLGWPAPWSVSRAMSGRFLRASHSSRANWAWVRTVPMLVEREKHAFFWPQYLHPAHIFKHILYMQCSSQNYLHIMTII